MLLHEKNMFDPYIGYNTKCIGAFLQSNRVGTSTHHIVTNTLYRETVT